MVEFGFEVAATHRFWLMMSPTDVGGLSTIIQKGTVVAANVAQPGRFICGQISLLLGMCRS